MIKLSLYEGYPQKDIWVAKAHIVSVYNYDGKTIVQCTGDISWYVEETVFHVVKLMTECQ